MDSSAPLSPFSVPALIAYHHKSSFCRRKKDGTEENLSLERRKLLPEIKKYPAFLVIYTPALIEKLKLHEEDTLLFFDILELFLFAFPAQNLPPTAYGLALFFKLIEKDYATPLEAHILRKITYKILDHLEECALTPQGDILRARLTCLEEAGWVWADTIKEVLYCAENIKIPSFDKALKSLHFWDKLPQNPEYSLRESENIPLTEEEIFNALRNNLSHYQEKRPAQEKLTLLIGKMLKPKTLAHSPDILLAEAGTGTGKTRAYLTPALLWAQKNDQALWISTYTKNLQRQIKEEASKNILSQKCPPKIALLKGRANYLCLRNFEELLKKTTPQDALRIPLTLLAHWGSKTQEGALIGGDLPSWVSGLFGYPLIAALSDEKNDCPNMPFDEKTGKGCPHYEKCFLERVRRKAHHADLVITNHSYIFSKNSWKMLCLEPDLPSYLLHETTSIPHYIFDEAHHIAHTADNAFSLSLSKNEGEEMARWLETDLKDNFILKTYFPSHEDILQKFLSKAFITLPTAPNERRDKQKSEAKKKRTLSSYENFLEKLAYACPHTHPQTELSENFIDQKEEYTLFELLETQNDNSVKDAAENLHKNLQEMRHLLRKFLTYCTLSIEHPQEKEDEITQSFEEISNILEKNLLSPPSTSSGEMRRLSARLQMIWSCHVIRLESWQEQDEMLKKLMITFEEMMQKPQENITSLCKNLKEMKENITSLFAAKKQEDAQETDITPPSEPLDEKNLLAFSRLISSLWRRIMLRLQAWQEMLEEIIFYHPPAQKDEDSSQKENFIYLIQKLSSPKDNRDSHADSLTLYRYYTDPLLPFSRIFQKMTDSLTMTSATLRDRDTPEEWDTAECQLGTPYFLMPAQKISFPSPFNYAEQARVYIINDIPRGDIKALSHGFSQLFQASHGDGLGLFTAISRLKKIYHLIAPELEAHHIPLYGQHIDKMDNNSLIDILKTEKRSCLLGTDALRDGIDVPGEGLRMVILEKTPWARHDILHQERKRLLSYGHVSSYKDHYARRNLKQAFGRLIRSKDDYGVFVLLDASIPTDFYTAFPQGVSPKMLPLAQAVKEIKNFLQYHQEKC